jgi:hypothetical protein
LKCPYCVCVVHADERTIVRGSFVAHSFCHVQHQRNGVYLLHDGSLKVHDHVLEPKAARGIVLLSMDYKMEERGRFA